MSLIQWGPKYSINVAEMDRQHKALIDMINEMHDAMRRGKGNNEADAILKKLVDYTVRHFSSEEALIRKHNFPTQLAHKQKHADFVAKIKAMQADLEKGTIGMAIKINTLLKDWLINHILVEDKKYAQHLNRLGVR